jgi:8-oxo-dGTP diphosphatase
MEKKQAIAVKILVRNGKGAILLVRREGTEAEGGYWDLPMGRVQWGEDPNLTAQRIAEEVAGLQIETEAPVAAWTFIEPPATHVNGITFRARAEDAQVKLGSGFDQHAWVTRASIKDFRMGDGVRRDVLRLGF